MTSDQALEVEEIPQNMLVIGGGYIGMELGIVYATFGTNVVVVEALGTILAGADKDLVKYVHDQSAKMFKEIRVNTKVLKMATKGKKIKVTLQQEDSDPYDEEYDRVLVSVGRGIEDQDNIEIVDELSKVMGADLSCSRPIVDVKWLEKSRQVGTSGQTVKPKVYMALGISGSFQHMGGIKGSPFIVAVNKNPKAPIFQVADVGVAEDILEFVPELADKIKESK
jgi:electron transfer flavoprotein alpha subunit